MRPVPSQPPRLRTLVLITILGIVSVNMFLPSLPNMASAYAITYAQASLSISVFMLITAVLQVIIGPLSDLYGRRPVLLWSLAIFTLASLGTALAPDFTSFMIFRVLQSSVIAGNVLSRAIVRDTSPPSEATARLGTIGMAIALGPMLAPVVGGTLDQLMGWRATLWVFFVAGAGLVWLCWHDLGETNATRGRGFAAHFRSYPALLSNLAFWSYTFSVGFGLGIFFAYLAATPILAVAVFDLPEGVVGALIGLPPVGFICGSYLSRRFGGRWATAHMVVIGRLVSVVGLGAALPLWWLGSGSALSLFVMMPVIGLANGISTPAGLAGAMSVRPDLAGSAAGLSGAVTVGCAAAMTAVSGALLGATADPARMLWLLLGLALLSVLAALPALRSHVSAPSQT
ncbi:multidrug effflux MFS transporter [Antarctobacter heliothermus]|uniref:Bcr/CflA family efflux transporter n=1 Tax=Antarctobacter heliothermus TaxID=74033 RepID=A0A239FG83_9RHOB|nr:multidrug effflux MFS transporter [Antarctobacter heliothermus]SNS55807.1 MFS transporter, DHA1 family, bicyclomycin/chloramphenicol resistance protein [Antarctobacter heliothermus]